MHVGVYVPWHPSILREGRVGTPMYSTLCMSCRVSVTQYGVVNQSQFCRRIGTWDGENSTYEWENNSDMGEQANLCQEKKR